MDAKKILKLDMYRDMLQCISVLIAYLKSSNNNIVAVADRLSFLVENDPEIQPLLLLLLYRLESKYKRKIKDL